MKKEITTSAKENGPEGPFPTQNNNMLRGVNDFAEGEEDDNGGNPRGEWDCHQNHEDRPSDHVCNTDQDSPCELEWADLYDRHTASEVECYLSHRKVGGEYRGATGPEDCGVAKLATKWSPRGNTEARKTVLSRTLNRLRVGI